MPTAGFQAFGASHLTAMALTLAVPVVLSLVARRAASGTAAAVSGYLLAAVLLVNEGIHWAYRLAEVGPARFAQDHLPLHVCGLAVLLTSAALLRRNQRVYEIAYFWGLVGSLNAVITPALEADYPTYRFFQYFISHSGIVAGVLFATWGLGSAQPSGDCCAPSCISTSWRRRWRWSTGSWDRTTCTSPNRPEARPRPSSSHRGRGTSPSSTPSRSPCSSGSSLPSS